MIIVKCLGEKKDTLEVDTDLNDNTINIQHLKDIIAQRLKVNQECIVVKFRGKELDNEYYLSQNPNMNLIAHIQKSTVKPQNKLAPPPIDDNVVIDQESPIECKGYSRACAFYGRAETDGYCTVCYKRKLRDQNRDEDTTSTTSTDSINTPKSHRIAPPPLQVPCASASASASTRPEQTDLEKCWKCNRRIGLLGFDCKCAYKFCAMHRQPEDHSCNYDFTEYKRKQLTDTLNSQSINQNKINRI